MRHHETGLHLADHISHPFPGLRTEIQRIVADIKEADVMDTERRGGVFRLCPAGRLHLFERHAVLLPQFGAFAALSERKANDGHFIAFRLVKCDCAPGAPYEIRRVRADHQRGFLVRHGDALPFRCRQAADSACRKPTAVDANMARFIRTFKGRKQSLEGCGGLSITCEEIPEPQENCPAQPPAAPGNQRRTKEGPILCFRHASPLYQ